MMGIPPGVLQVQRCEQDLNVPQFVDYIGETVRNLAVRIAEHSNLTHTSEPAKHLREYDGVSSTFLAVIRCSLLFLFVVLRCSNRPPPPWPL